MNLKKLIRVIIIIIFTVYAISSFSAKRNTKSNDYKIATAKNIVTVDQAKEMIDSSRDMFILDVRTSGEYKAGHIKKANLIPMELLETKFSKVPMDRDVIVVCAVGGRSSAATTFLLNKGYTKVYDMLGGMVKWQKKGYPVEK